jgi:hypothetical protein
MGVKFQIKYLGGKAPEEISDENQRLLANYCNTNRNVEVTLYHKVGDKIQKLMVDFTMLDVHLLDDVDEDTKELRILELVHDPTYNMGFVFVDRYNVENSRKYSDENQHRFIDHFNRTPINRILAVHKQYKENGEATIEEHLVDFNMMTAQNISTMQFNKLCIGWW